MIAIYIIIGFFPGVLLTFLIMRKRYISAQNLLLENMRLKTEIEYNHKTNAELKNSFAKEKIALEKQRIDSEKNNEILRRESDRQWEIKFEKLKEELQNITTKLLVDRQASLQQTNRDQVTALLDPIKQQFEEFQKTINDSKASNEISKKEIQETFKSTLAIFEKIQNHTIEELKKETSRIGNDANNLTNALKRDTKKQGNWGEMILESILENSGLKKDNQYFIQETIETDKGKIFRPDVIIRFPEGKSIVIDSKVSLTAYADSFDTHNEEIRSKKLKEHARSVRKHIDELAEKRYDSMVKNAIGFTLMFIPNDQCFIAALEEDPSLDRYAYSKGIVMISPSNLMVALQMVYNFWQQDSRNRNIDKIVKSAEELYDKVAVFSETLKNLSKNFDSLYEGFRKAKNQFYEGQGNIISKIENLKELGITPKKEIICQNKK